MPIMQCWMAAFAASMLHEGYKMTKFYLHGCPVSSPAGRYRSASFDVEGERGETSDDS